MHPFTFLACTYNLWATYDWPKRMRPLERFLQVQRPDILCVQELSSETTEVILQTMPHMASVIDPFEGWVSEGNIFWNTEIFTLKEYGAEQVGILEEKRRLFWVRLSTSSGESLFVATAHFSWTGNIREITENLNVRVGQAEACAEAIDGLVQPDEPALFMGDFNDYIHPLRVLRMAGFDDSFMALGQEPVITCPAFPMTNQPPEILDWMMHRGLIQPTLTSVVDFHVKSIAPSDHKPVLTTYQLNP